MIEVRELTQQSELAECVRLQKQIWGFEDIDLLPVRLFIVAGKIGGQVLGAFDDGRMVGFCLCIPGLKPGGASYLHSHMMGVVPDYRNRGVGRLLKQTQRSSALARGVKLIEWTFDPLEIKNAFFNIERLGAVVRRYVLNQYGTSSSHLHGGLPTDRCVAEWYINGPRATSLADGKALSHPQIVARISVPAGIDALKQADPQRARDIQHSISEQFLRHFEQGHAVIGFERSPQAGTYLLGPWAFE